MTTDSRVAPRREGGGVNVELLEEVMQVIETYPEDWDQTCWIADCGTAFCFAGHAVLRTHPEWSIEVTAEGRAMPSLLDENFRPVQPSFNYLGRSALGITPSEAEMLFASTNSLARLRELVNQIKARAARGVPTNTEEARHE